VNKVRIFLDTVFLELDVSTGVHIGILSTKFIVCHVNFAECIHRINLFSNYFNNENLSCNYARNLFNKIYYIVSAHRANSCISWKHFDKEVLWHVNGNILCHKIDEKSNNKSLLTEWRKEIKINCTYSPVSPFSTTSYSSNMRHCFIIAN
jgi:hypothetical protein